MADIEPDPVTQAYTAIWTYLTNSTKWAALVKPQNRIRFDQTTPRIYKDALQRADFPQARLILGSGEWNNLRSQAYSLLAQGYQLELLSGLDQIGLMHANLVWQTTRALAKAPYTLGKDFVTEFTYQTNDTSLDPVDMLAGKTGWITTVQISVKMKFDRDQLETD